MVVAKSVSSETAIVYEIDLVQARKPELTVPESLREGQFWNFANDVGGKKAPPLPRQVRNQAKFHGYSMIRFAVDELGVREEKPSGRVVVGLRHRWKFAAKLFFEE